MLSTLFFILIIVVEHIVETAFSRQLESKPRNYLHVLYQTYCVNLRTVFFCHAEDGIRDATVTGVQTCALPICTTPVICPECNGRGVVSESQGLFALSQPCPRCRGNGTVVEKPCAKCHGTGRERRTKRYS